MTQDNIFNVQSVAIIGSGAAGLTTLFELLHTRRDGSTTISYNWNGDLDASKLKNEDPAFNEIVVFEQTSRIGGIWAPSFDTPDIIPQEALNTERYNDPYILNPKEPLPDDLNKGSYSFEKRLITKEEGSKFKWTNSGIYSHLYSNVPSRYLRNSFIPYSQNAEGRDPLQNFLDPLVTNIEITNRLLAFADRFELVNHIRLDSEVADIRRTADGLKWKVSVKQSALDSSAVEWYTELFDAVIISTGHYSVPYIPNIKGLTNWNKKIKSSIFHSKSFRDPKIFKDKVCLFVGTGLSGMNILQYAFPIAKRVIVSRSIGKEEIYKWLTNAANSDGITVKPRIRELQPGDGKKVIFEDGSAISDIDYIVLCTGYHWHYPFLNSEDTGVSVIPRSGGTPDGSSRLGGLYLNSFSIKEPTLAFVGVTVAPFQWPSFELAASAIAGVWSNSTKLPEKKEQIERMTQRLNNTSQSIEFHYYSLTKFSEYVDEVAGYLPKGRDPSDIFDTDHLDDMLTCSATAERLFYHLKNSRIPVDAILQ